MNQRPKDYVSSTAQDYVRNRSGVPLHPERDRFFEGGLQMPALEYSAWKLERARKRSIFERPLTAIADLHYRGGERLRSVWSSGPTRVLLRGTWSLYPPKPRRQLDHSGFGSTQHGVQFVPKTNDEQ